MACETIKMEISANPDFVSIIRLTTSGIANKIGFSIDDIEDMKVAVSEACTNAIKHSDDKSVSITYTILENGLDIEIKDNGKGCKAINYGFGLKQMVERVSQIRGDINFYSENGFTTEIKIPL